MDGVGVCGKVCCEKKEDYIDDGIGYFPEYGYSGTKIEKKGYTVNAVGGKCYGGYTLEISKNVEVSLNSCPVNTYEISNSYSILTMPDGYCPVLSYTKTYYGGDCETVEFKDIQQYSVDSYVFKQIVYPGGDDTFGSTQTCGYSGNCSWSKDCKWEDFGF